MDSNLPPLKKYVRENSMVQHRQVSHRKKEKGSDCENVNYGPEWDSKKLEISV